MIKQTRGALTMLLSVYRSVLKNAYLKNFAAVALAASVGIASAGQAVINGYAGNPEDAKDVKVTGSEAKAITAGDTEAAVAYAKEVTVEGSDVKLTITGTADKSATLNADEVAIGASGTVSLVGGTAGATINGPVTINGESAKLDFTSDTTSAGDVTLTKGSVTVTAGEATVESLSSAKDGSVTVTAGKLTVNNDLSLADEATLDNSGEILVSGTATIGKITVSENKLGTLKFVKKADFTQKDDLTIDASEKLTFQSDGIFAGNVTNVGEIILDKEANVSVNGIGGLTNNKTLTVAEDANVTLTGKVTNAASTGTINVAAASGEGKNTKATFASDVDNAGSITLGERSNVTFEGALKNTGAVSSSGILSVKGKLTNAESGSVTLKVAKLGEVDNSGTITVSANGNATFGGKLTNAGKVTITDGADADHKTVASFAGVVNEGAISLGANSDVSFENLENKGTLASLTDLDLVGKLTNTGIVNVNAGTLKASFESLGLTASGSAAQANVANGAALDIGDASVSEGIFVAADTDGKIHNGGTIKAGTLTVTDDADLTLANAGTLSVDSLNINKSLTSAASKLTVAKSVSTKGENAELSGTVILDNDGKVNGTVTGFKSVFATIKGLWNLGSAEIKAGSTINNGATVSGVGTIENATISAKSNVTAESVKAATLSDGSVLNAGKVEATAAASAPISLTASTLNVGNITVGAGSNATDAAISANALLTGSTVKITGEYTAVANGLVANLTGSTLELDANKNKSDAGVETIRGNAESTLVINGISGPVKLSKNTELTTSLDDGADGTLAGVYKKIGVNGSNFAGQIKGLTYDTTGVVEDGKVSLDDIGDYSTIASSTDAFASAQVTGVDNTALGSKLNVGSILANNGTTTVDISTGDIALNTATDGLLVAQAGAAASDPSTVADVKFSGAGKLALNGAGKVGNIDAGADGNGTLTVNADVTAGKIGSTNAIGKLTVSSGTLTAKDVKAKVTTVDGNLVADSLTAATGAAINGSLKLKKDSNVATSGILTAPMLFTSAKSTVSVDKIVAATSANLSGYVSASDIDTTALTIGDSTPGSEMVGLVTVGKLSSAATTVTVNNGLLKVGEDATGVTLTVDKAGSASFDKNLTLADAAQTIEGELKVAGTLTNGNAKLTVGSDGANGATGSVYADTLLGTGGIFVDPNYGQRASGVASMHLDSATTPGSETTTQDIVVGKNAFVAVGVSSEAQARSVLSSLGLTDANGSFREDGVNNAFYTDALVKLAAANQLEIASANTTGTASGAAGQITLGDKSAVVIGKNAAAQSVKDRKAVLTADINGTGVTVAGKSKVIFAGNATKQDIKDVKVFGNEGAGNQVFADADEAAKVSVQLSPLYNEAKLTVDGGITDITVNRGYINTALYNASLPVKNMVAEVADTALTGDGVGSDFIMENALVDGGANIESAARLATFGGAYQAAAAAVNTGIDAAQARLGLGIDNSAEVKGEDISVWANAVYKNTESDSFEAQGANYGADLDLTSLVIGADYNMAEGSKVGAYATFGTGDVDGKGAGHNVKNDVDTYGFGIYGSTKLASGVSILSDVGYTVAQNEFKGIVNADADMKVFTAGANVKYTFNTQVADISPFVGARYTSFNLESYAVKSAKGIVAYTDADTAHIFSIPVGFDLSKQITAGEWNVKPAFTAKVTFNTGDKTVSSSTQFTGVKNTLNLDAEVMDDVTYSVGASVSATKGAATFGAGLSYTGSSETNELSAQIGARYTF